MRVIRRIVPAWSVAVALHLLSPSSGLAHPGHDHGVFRLFDRVLHETSTGAVWPAAIVLGAAILAWRTTARVRR